MSDLGPVLELGFVVALWVGGITLAAARWTQRTRLGGAAAIILSATSVAALIMGVPAISALPGLLLAGAWLVTIQPVSEHLLAALGNRRVQAASFLLAGPLLACAWAVFWDAPDADPLPTPQPVANRQPEAPPEPLPTSQIARTDLGRPVPLFTRPATDVSNQADFDEQHLASTRPLTMIRTAASDSASNCHGWVFAGGHFWIRNEAVEGILHDNAYESAAQPRSGDIVVYRDDEGKVVHSGIVRIAVDGLIMVESKWGMLGRYLHAPTAQPYGRHATFYHSVRRGHLLHIGDSEVPAEDITEE